MSANTVTLASIREAADAKFGSTVIDLGSSGEVELVNALRLPKAKREELAEMQAAEDEGVDVYDQMSALVRLVARSESQAEALLAAVGDDVAVLAQVMETYTKGTQVGEASSSES